MSTHIENTVVSGSSLMSNLSTADLQQLLLNVALDPAENVVLSNTLLYSGNLTYDNWVTALTAPSGLGLDTTSVALTGTHEIGITNEATDSAEYARKLIGLFNLSSSSNPVVAKFQIAKQTTTNTADMIIALSNKSATSNNVIMNGGTEATMWNTANTPTLRFNVGSQRLVEIYATNFTSGSEVVVFNVQSE